MVTNASLPASSILDGLDSDIDDDENPWVDGPAVTANADPVAAALDAAEVVPGPQAQPKKDLLEIRGFFIDGGEGVYDGATRADEEPRENYFVDVQDYHTGKIERVWGVALRDVIRNARDQINLQPGSRVHLVQQGKQAIFSDHVNDQKEMVMKKTYANAWQCHADRGPLPSQLAHLMAGINVDKLLNRIAMRHDMGLDHPGLAGWKQEQLRLLKAIGDDPSTIKGWLERQMQMGADEERRLVDLAVGLDGYGDADPSRRQMEVDARLSALKMMQQDARYDYLMETAKPHLIEANRARETQMHSQVIAAIEQFVMMAKADVPDDSPARLALRSAMLQSVDGLTPSQQVDYIAQRRESLLKDKLASQALAASVPEAGAVDKNSIIDARGLSVEEYKKKLEEKVALGETPEEQAALLAAEAEVRKLESDEAARQLEPIANLYSRIAHERDVDMTAYYLSMAIGAIANSIASIGAKILPTIQTTFEELGGVGAWRRRGCESALSDMHGALHAARSSAVYHEFEYDPQVLAACGGRQVADVVANSADFARSDVVQAHLDAQLAAKTPVGRVKPLVQGLWSGVVDAVHEMSDRVSYLKPEHLVKDGKLDAKWLDGMQKGLSEFTGQLKGTLMPDNIREQIQQMIASILDAIKMFVEMAKGFTSAKAYDKPETSSVELGR